MTRDTTSHRSFFRSSKMRRYTRVFRDLGRAGSVVIHDRQSGRWDLNKCKGVEVILLGVDSGVEKNGVGDVFRRIDQRDKVVSRVTI